MIRPVSWYQTEATLSHELIRTLIPASISENAPTATSMIMLAFRGRGRPRSTMPRTNVKHQSADG